MPLCEVSSPLRGRQNVPALNVTLRALGVCGEVAVGLALQAVLTAVLNLLATWRGACQRLLAGSLTRTLYVGSGSQAVFAAHQNGSSPAFR